MTWECARTLTSRCTSGLPPAHEPVFPATEEALRQFVTFQSQSCQYSTLKNYLYGIREYHLARGMPFAPLAEQVGLW